MRNKELFFLPELVGYNLPLIFWFWLLVILQFRQMDAEAPLAWCVLKDLVMVLL